MSETLKHLSCPVVVLRVSVAEVRGDDLADDLREEMLAVYERSQAVNAVVDFAAVNYLSSAGFRPLLSMQRKVRERGGRLVLCGLTPVVEEIFVATRLISTSGISRAAFEVQKDVSAAVAHLFAAPAAQSPG